MSNEETNPTVTVGWTDLLSLEMKIRYAKRHLCEAVMFAHGDIVQHIDSAYVDLVRATELLSGIIKGDDQA